MTVPVISDTETHRIVNNSEDDICRMFDGAFRSFASATWSFPCRHRDASRRSFPPSFTTRVNNGV